jgi:EAL domain-containing protein (putative c-di-GMP-specific phosphodiesterase class I)
LSRARRVRLGLQIDNWRHIAAAYGADAAGAVVEHVEQLASDWGGGDSLSIEHLGEGRFFLQSARAPGAEEHRADLFVACDIRTRCLDLQYVAIRYRGCRLRISVSWRVIFSGAQEEAYRRKASYLVADGLQGQRRWVRAYRRDMEASADLLEALANGELWLLWQPVGRGGDPASTLFDRAVLHRVDMANGGFAEVDEVSALERTGLIHLLDRWVAAQVFEQLSEDPEAILGLNISGRSMGEGQWVTTLAEGLRQRPDVARRLVFFMGGQDADFSRGDVGSFVQLMHRLGCRVAVGGFGAGGAALGPLFAHAPDMIELDARFVAWAARSPRGRALFENLVGVASVLASTVIASGVRSDDQRAIAEQAGVGWLRGDLVGRPRMSRSRRPPGRDADSETVPASALSLEMGA